MTNIKAGEHTQGEWKVNKTNGRIFSNVKKTALAQVYSLLDDPHNKEKEANENLIASAPKMLEALEAIKAKLKEGKEVNGTFVITMALLEAIMEQGESAIKSAKGE